jgi:hypothetical protein
MSHSGDANKMVSDTPRTTDRVVFIDGNPWVNAPFARGLERELNAANQRIKRLEDGDAALTYSIGLDLQKENEALKARIKRLEEESESDWHLAQSAIGSCAEMSSRIKRLEEAGDALKAAGYFGGWADAVNKWIKVREDKL